MKSFPHLSIVVILFFLSFDCSAIAGNGKRGASAEPAASASADSGPSSSRFLIPGPLRSFLRMAGISQEISREDVLPLLSWNVSTIGYQGGNHPTEYLILLIRYVAQARELAALAGQAGVIRVSGCGDAATLLHILGYRIASTCGQPSTSLLTGDPERAFLTIDSGFPLTELEQTLQGGAAFQYSYASTNVPVLFSAPDWNVSNKKKFRGDSTVVDTILGDRTIARLYWALSKMDPETRLYLRHILGTRKLLEYGALLDFYGEHIRIRHGRVLVPGGADADSDWEAVAGANPSDPVDFIPGLLTKDNGWLVAYFDVLSSVSRRQQAYFTKSVRLRKFYGALRPTKPASATAGVFRPAPWLLLLISQIQWAPNGEPLIPGGMEVWREILPRWKDSSHLTQSVEKRNLKTPDDLLESMFAISRESVDDGPLQAYLALSRISSKRPHGHGLGPETVRLMCLKFSDFSDQYRIFSEFPQLDDASILLFLKVAEHLDKIPNPERDDALGIIQANIGIWQILARQGQIPGPRLEHSWQSVVKPFERARTSSQLYDAGRASLTQLFAVATGERAISQDEIVDLLAGPQQTIAEGKKIHTEVADGIRSVLDAQRLVSLDTLIALDDGLKNRANGNPPEEYLFHLADQLHEFQMP
ncbi:MAG: hypothetical protein WA824_01035, partial [Candidatus Sulfotelmatobacter sp.]